MVREPILFCFCGPVAGGKSTMCRRISETDGNIEQCISTTTRTPRAGEVDGQDYYFLDLTEFERRVAAGEFLENASVSGNRYGIERRNFDRVRNSGKDLALNIDYVGARTLRRTCAEQLVVIYLAPPSLDALRERIAKRGDSSAELIQKRLDLAIVEMEALADPALTNYRVLNSDFEAAVLDVRAIVTAERLRLRPPATS